jgi:hypothetical protein
MAWHSLVSTAVGGLSRLKVPHPPGVQVHQRIDEKHGKVTLTNITVLSTNAAIAWQLLTYINSAAVSPCDF